MLHRFRYDLPKCLGYKYIGAVVCLLAVLIVPRYEAHAQIQPDPSVQRQKLLEFAQRQRQAHEANRAEALRRAEQLGIPTRRVFEDGRVVELQAYRDGRFYFYTTHNLNAARTIGADRVWNGGDLGLSLSGSGERLGIWDGGAVRASHREFSGRVQQQDGATSLSNHATHVAGTMVARGARAAARGMAFNAQLDAYDWGNDDSEMAEAAAAGMLVSNHSYGFIHGWTFDYRDDGRWVWFGNEDVSETEDAGFGYYDYQARNWDQIAINAPYYLIVKSAGNDRNDRGPGPGGEHWIYGDSGWELSTVTRDPDCGPDGYDCIGAAGNAKNVLTVGAINDIPGGFSDPSDVRMSSFSGWGPTDDGRIKPDIVANGTSLTSSLSGADDAYGSYSGTSMAAPSMAGAVGLLHEHYRTLNDGRLMRASTVKALLAHTADEAGGTPGPDYVHGWGLANIGRAAELIGTDALQGGQLVQEFVLQEGAIIEIMVNVDGTKPLRATTAWTDPAGPQLALQLDARTPVLVNDLDIEIIGPDANRYQPWVLDPANPAAAAATGDNAVDNIEQVLLANPDPGLYLVRISHKGSLEGQQQPFSLILNTPPRPTYQIAGRVHVEGSDEGVRGVEVRLSGEQTLTATTDAEGAYVFSALNDGSYTVTPDESNYDVQPNSRAVTISGADVEGLDFTVPPPVARASTEAIRATVASGATAARTLTLTNEGAYDLNYTLRLRLQNQQSAMAARGEVAKQSLSVQDLRQYQTGGTPSPYRASASGAAPDVIPVDATRTMATSAYSSASQTAPSSVANGALFGVDPRAHRIVRLHPSNGEVIESFALPGTEAGSSGPQGLAYDGVALYYVNGFGTDAIYQLDAETGEVLQSGTIEGLPEVDALAHSGSALYAVSYEANAIFEVDLASKTVVRVIEPGISLGGGVTFGGTRGTLFASDFSATIHEIDPASGDVLNSMDAPGNVYGLAYSRALDVLLVSTSESGTVRALDPDNGRVKYQFGTSGLSGLAADEGATTPWIYFDSSEPRTGTLASSQQVSWPLKLDARQRLGGTYEADLVITTNDPDQSELIVPVTMQVRGGIAGRITVGDAPAAGIQVALSGDAEAATETRHDGRYRFYVGPGTYSVDPSYSGATFTPAMRDVTVADAALIGQNFALSSPVVGVDPASVSAVLGPGQAIERTLTIANDGDPSTTLAYEFPAFAAQAAIERAGAKQNETAPRYASADLRKNDADTREGHPVVLGAGGPDAFGYRWIDSNEEGGPSFAWRDVSSTGTRLELQNTDDGSRSVALPFAFPFYGEDKTEVKVSANGYLTFGSRGDAYTNEELPNAAAPNDLIAVLWDDLVIYSGGGIYTYADTENGQFIVQWNEVSLLNNGERQTFQVTLSSSGAIRFQYQRIKGGPSATVGIENADGSTGLQVAFNAGYAEDNLAVDIAPWPSYIQDVSPAFGEVAGGSQQRVTVTLRADEAMAVGDYTGALALATNDVATPSVSIPVNLTVQEGVPRIAVRPDMLSLPRTLIGSSSTGQITIANEGTGTLTVSAIMSDNEDVQAALDAPLRVPAGESKAVEVVFAPSAPGPITATLTVQHSDVNQPSVTVQVEGEGQQPAVAAVTPGAFTETLQGGMTTTKNLRIENKGGAPLDYHLDLELINERPDDLFASASDARIEEAVVTHPVIIDDPSGDGGGADVATLRAERVGPQVAFEVVFSSAVTWNSLNGYLALDTDRDPATGTALTFGNEDQDVGAEFEIDLAIGTERQVKLAHTTRGEVATYPAETDGAILRFSIPLADLDGDDGSMNVAGVVRTGNSKRDWFPDKGHGTLTGWMSLSTVAGTVQPGGANDVEVVLDASRLAPGSYKARLLVETNDPVQPTVEVPAELTVDGIVLSWSANITVRDANTRRVVTIGQSPGASDALDPIFGETRSGGSAGGLDAWLELPGGPTSRVDIRSDAPASLVSWRLALQPGASSETVTLSWDRTQWPSGGTFILSDMNGGETLRVNMRMQSSIEVDANVLDRMVIAFAPSASPRSVPGPPGRVVVVSQGGVYDVAGTAVEVDLRDATGEGTVLVQRFDGAPKFQAHSVEATVPGIEENYIADHYWLVAYTGSLKPGPESALRFKLSGFEQSVGRPGDVVVYRQRTDAEDAFASVASSVDDQGDPNPKNDIIVVRQTDLSGTYVMASANDFAPIQLGTFEADAGADRIDLAWSTAFEVDNKGFAVQRRLDGAPAFETIGFVESQGNSTDEQRYQFADDALPYTASEASYRLVWVDATDDTEQEFAVLDAAIELPDAVTLHPNFPNPVQVQTTIRYELPEASRVSLTVYNILGQRVATLVDGDQPAGRKELTLDASRLASGAYFLRLITDDTARTQRIAVVK